MKYRLLLLFMGIWAGACAQQKTVDGFVLDKLSKERIAKINVVNMSTGESVYNNLKGEFTINAQPGDKLIFQRTDYKPDTIKLQDVKSLVVYLMPIAIPLRQVEVHDTMLNPQKHLEQIKRDYSKIYGSLDYSDPFAISPMGGAGISIDALWNALSRSGRNAEKLRQNIQRDYQQEVIDYRFNKTYVGNITKLKEPQLTDFMRRFRPGYFTVTTDTEYEFITYIKNALRRYQRAPRSGYTLQPLVSGK